ncbi:hypothetical protein K402DRAFT_426087, partial [Aulographum hederae CBS 113979]
MAAAEVASGVRSSLRQPLPLYLTYLEELRVMLCAEHTSCYTRESLPRHLCDQHGVPADRRREILADFPQLAQNPQIAERRRREVWGNHTVDGLPVLRGLACCESGCEFYSVSEDWIQRHCRKEHGRAFAKGRRKRSQQLKAESDNTTTGGGGGGKAYRPVDLQTLWAKKGQVSYFPIDADSSVRVKLGARETGKTSETRETEETRDTRETRETEETRETGEEEQRQGQEQQQQQQEAQICYAWKEIEVRFRQAQEKQARAHGDGGVVERHNHISELTPWLRQTGYHSHLQDLPLDQIAESYQLPDGMGEQEPELAAICSSIDRVLRRSMAVLERDYHGTEEKRRLSRLNSKLLNTFRGAEMSQDPIKPLQNSRSKQTYIRSWQKLACYYYRVTQDGCLR